MADMWQVAGRGTPGDDAARFLRELRQLRDGAGLGQAELAARAHYPYDTIRAAEAGPALPDLPVLSAYVRGCGGTAEEWEERWRSLTRTPALPVPAARHAGNSAAATAGARIGTATQVADAPDPSIIIAALNRVAEEMATGTDTPNAPLSDLPRPAYPDDGLPAGPLPQPSDLASASSAVFPDSPFGGPAVPAAPPAPGPETGRAAGWDPIRVSSAWPAIGSEAAQQTRAPDDTTSMDAPPWESPAWEVPPWESESWPPWLADSASHGETVTAEPEVIVPSSVASPAAPPESVTPEAGPAAPSAGRPASASAQRADRAQAAGSTGAHIRQSAWAGGAAGPSEAGGAAHPGSRARTVIFVVVLVCVLAVVLAIFA